jgi:hypothetical protein
MTDENAGAQKQPDVPHATELAEREFWYDREHRDWALQMFVGVCNVSGIEIPVTLNLTGSYVSGYIVKPEAYFDGLKDDIHRSSPRGAASDAVKKSLEELISKMKELSVSKPESDEAASGTDSRSFSPRYIHLRGARFFVPNDLLRSFPQPLPGAQNVWWRGKIEAVSGFVLGTPFET